jgi:hypothetical protein
VNPNAIGESGSHFASGSKSDGLDRLKQSPRDLCPRLNEGGQALGKDFASAIRIAAEELADREMKDAPFGLHKGHLAVSADTNYGPAMMLENKAGNKRREELKKWQVLRGFLAVLSAPPVDLMEKRTGMTYRSLRGS